MALTFGTIRVSANAIPFQTKTGFEIMLQGGVRTAIVGKDGAIHGYSVEHQAGSIEGAVTYAEGQDLQALFDLSGADVQLEMTGVGITFVVSEAEYTGPRSFSTDEGGIPFKVDGIITVLRD